MPIHSVSGRVTVTAGAPSRWTHRELSTLAKLLLAIGALLSACRGHDSAHPLFQTCEAEQGYIPYTEGDGSSAKATVPDLGLMDFKCGLPSSSHMWWSYCQGKTYAQYRARDNTRNVLVYLGTHPNIQSNVSRPGIARQLGGHDAIWYQSNRSIEGYPHVRETVFEHQDPRLPKDRTMVHVIVAAASAQELEQLMTSLAKLEFDDAPFR